MLEVQKKGDLIRGSLFVPFSIVSFPMSFDGEGFEHHTAEEEAREEHIEVFAPERVKGTIDEKIFGDIPLGSIGALIKEEVLSEGRGLPSFAAYLVLVSQQQYVAQARPHADLRITIPVYVAPAVMLNAYSMYHAPAFAYQAEAVYEGIAQDYAPSGIYVPDRTLVYHMLMVRPDARESYTQEASAPLMVVGPEPVTTDLFADGARDVYVAREGKRISAYAPAEPRALAFEHSNASSDYETPIVTRLDPLTYNIAEKRSEAKENVHGAIRIPVLDILLDMSTQTRALNEPEINARTAFEDVYRATTTSNKDARSIVSEIELDQIVEHSEIEQTQARTHNKTAVYFETNIIKVDFSQNKVNNQPSSETSSKVTYVFEEAKRKRDYIQERKKQDLCSVKPEYDSLDIETNVSRLREAIITKEKEDLCAVSVELEGELLLEQKTDYYPNKKDEDKCAVRPELDESKIVPGAKYGSFTSQLRLGDIRVDRDSVKVRVYDKEDKIITVDSSPNTILAALELQAADKGNVFEYEVGRWGVFIKRVQGDHESISSKLPEGYAIDEINYRIFIRDKRTGEKRHIQESIEKATYDRRTEEVGIDVEVLYHERTAQEKREQTELQRNGAFSFYRRTVTKEEAEDNSQIYLSGENGKSVFVGANSEIGIVHKWLTEEGYTPVYKVDENFRDGEYIGTFVYRRDILDREGKSVNLRLAKELGLDTKDISEERLPRFLERKGIGQIDYAQHTDGTLREFIDEEGHSRAGQDYKPEAGTTLNIYAMKQGVFDVRRQNEENKEAEREATQRRCPLFRFYRGGSDGFSNITVKDKKDVGTSLEEFKSHILGKAMADYGTFHDPQKIKFTVNGAARSLDYRIQLGDRVSASYLSPQAQDKVA